MFSPSAADQVAVDVQMCVELSQEVPGGPFSATLIRQETRWWDNDPEPDVVETMVCEKTFDAALPQTFAAVDAWLIPEHRLRVVPTSWLTGDTGQDTGMVTFLMGRAVSVQSPNRLLPRAFH